MNVVWRSGTKFKNGCGPHGILAKRDRGVFSTNVEKHGVVGDLGSLLGGSKRKMETLLADDTTAFGGMWENEEFVRHAYVFVASVSCPR